MCKGLVMVMLKIVLYDPWFLLEVFFGNSISVELLNHYNSSIQVDL
jgi:hypothetical protein